MIPHVSQIDQINRSTPAAARTGLGTQIADLSIQFNLLRSAVEAIYLKNQFVLTPATLVIKAAEGVVPKSTSAFSVLVAGVVQSKSANTDMAALSGTLATAKACLFVFYIDSAGTLTTVKTSDEAAAIAAIAALPALPANKVRIGYLVVANATGSNFVGGTTALDVADLTVTYVNEPALSSFAVTAVPEWA